MLSRIDRIDRAADGWAVDLGLYALSFGFAVLTALTATLPPHAAWGPVAASVYGVAAVVSLVAVVLPGFRLRPVLPARRRLAITVAIGTAALPLVIQAWQRAHGVAGRAQEEVLVVEDGGHRLLHTGTPYLGHDAIAALPADERLLGYLPYQPGMALFGLPRALFGNTYWTDARVWFVLVTFAAVGWALRLLRRAGSDGRWLVRGWQAVLVVPLGTLALAVGGDDLPVLALCLLALAYAATGRDVAAGVAVGIAGALKLFAWPVALVLVVLAATRVDPATRPDPGPPEQPASPAPVPPGQRTRLDSVPPVRRALRTAAGALGIPILVLVPPALVDPGAFVENVIRFPLGQGLVTSPAASNLPGHLIALWLPGGHGIAAGLLVLAGLAIAAWLWRRPLGDAGDASLVCAVGLLAATMLMPATRFGYLLYPLAFAVWVPALRPARSREQAPVAGQTLEA